MELIGLNKRENIDQNKKLSSAYTEFGELLSELSKKDLPSKIVDTLNSEIEEINSSTSSEKKLRKLIRATQSKSIQLLEKELKLVVKNHYRNVWLAVGMSAFGVPLGVVFGMNMDLIGLGLPIGMVIGMVIGTRMDKKAFEEGRQLDLEIRF